ncbi:MAG: LysR family transcriptional regulator [Alphaproteobacteria bacterium]|nr:LysR family transcriptional regulator [Alphaproteobacteria bacterium]
MRLKQFKVFDTIVRAGSISAAARELSITQSAVSRILAKFENELGYELFYRKNGRLTPSSRSALVLARVRRVLEAVSGVNAVKSDGIKPGPPFVELVTVPSLAHSVIPQVLREYVDIYPEARIHLDVRTTLGTINALISQSADFGLLTLPVSHPTLRVEPLFRMKSSCILRRDHPLAEKDVITVQDLADEPLVLLSRRQPTRLLIDDAFARNGVRPKVRVETATVLSACRCAEEGVGIAMVNTLMASYLLDKTMAIRPFGSQIHHTLALVEPAGLQRTRQTADFLSCFCTNVLRKIKEESLEIDYLRDTHSFLE